MDAEIKVVDNYNSPALFRTLWLSNIGGNTVQPDRFKLEGEYGAPWSIPVLVTDIDVKTASFDLHIPIHLLSKESIQESEFTLSAVNESGEEVDSMVLVPEPIEVEFKNLISHIQAPTPGSIKPTEESADSNFGAGSAISANGSVLVVSAPGFKQEASEADETPEKNGAIYTFLQSAITSEWQLVALDLAEDEQDEQDEQGEIAEFGVDAKLSNDGSLLTVMDFNSDEGKAGISLYKHDEETEDGEASYWQFKQRVEVESDRAQAMAFSGDGTRLAVGVFNGTSEVIKLFSVDAAAEDSIKELEAELVLGPQERSPTSPSVESPKQSLSFSEDGKLLAAGSSHGRAYIFRDRDDDGKTWDSVPIGNPLEVDEQFGSVVALSSKGNVLAVSGVDTDESGKAFGIVHVYRDESEEPWSSYNASNALGSEFVAKSLNLREGENEEFGYAIALSGDGSVLAVSAPGDAGNTVGVWGEQANNDAPESGAVFIYRYLPDESQEEDGWQKDGNYIKASNIEEEAAGEFGDRFGSSLALSKDGLTLMVGAPDYDIPVEPDDSGDDQKPIKNAGAVYLY
ncbi:MAG: hypothetical protein K0U59_07210 [Gammaproteobacteria bacterium]|nr:hypothetical protein [Gammaproteobacteria bacterium]